MSVMVCDGSAGAEALLSRLGGVAWCRKQSEDPSGAEQKLYYFFADSINLIRASVTFGSKPSVCPLSTRMTSATTLPFLHFGYWKTSAAPGLGRSPHDGFGGF